MYFRIMRAPVTELVSFARGSTAMVRGGAIPPGYGTTGATVLHPEISNTYRTLPRDNRWYFAPPLCCRISRVSLRTVRSLTICYTLQPDNQLGAACWQGVAMSIVSTAGSLPITPKGQSRNIFWIKSKRYFGSEPILSPSSAATRASSRPLPTGQSRRHTSRQTLPADCRPRPSPGRATACGSPVRARCA